MTWESPRFWGAAIRHDDRRYWRVWLDVTGEALYAWPHAVTDDFGELVPV